MNDDARLVTVLRAAGNHHAADALLAGESDAQKIADARTQQLAGDIVKLRNDLDALANALLKLTDACEKDITANRDARKALVDSVGQLRTILDGRIEAEVHQAALLLEREFGSCLSLTAGSGARKTANDDKLAASLESLERRASRQGEHLARIEDRLKRIERG